MNSQKHQPYTYIRMESHRPSVKGKGIEADHVEEEEEYSGMGFMESRLATSAWRCEGLLRVASCVGKSRAKKIK